MLVLLSSFPLLINGTTQQVIAKQELSQLNLSVSLGEKALKKDLYQMAIWVEDTQGRYIETLFVTHCTGKEGLGNDYLSFFGFNLRSAPAVLPVWAHKRNVRYGESFYPSRKEPLPDGMTGATVKTSEFNLSFPLPQEIVDKAKDDLVCRVELNVVRDGFPSLNFSGTLATDEDNTQALALIGFGDDKGRNGDVQKEVEKKLVLDKFVKELKATLHPVDKSAESL